MARLFILLMLAMALCGCGTLFQGHEDSGPAIYGGIRFDVQSIAQAEDAVDVLLMLMDLPFSLVADTVILPWSIYNEIDKGGIDTRSFQQMGYRSGCLPPPVRKAKKEATTGGEKSPEKKPDK